MLSQLKNLSLETDGRYATDAELQFLIDYARSYRLRLETYQKLKEIEAEVVQQVYTKMRSMEPGLLRSGNEDVSAKWKGDTLRVLRYSAIAMLMNDPDTLQERFLYWFQSIMRAFGAQRSCGVTYELMQSVIKKHLSASQADLFCPVLELNRRLLGTGN